MYHPPAEPRPIMAEEIRASALGSISGGTSPPTAITATHSARELTAPRNAIATPCENPANTIDGLVGHSAETASTTADTYAMLSPIANSRSWRVIQLATTSSVRL